MNPKELEQLHGAATKAIGEGRLGTALNLLRQCLDKGKNHRPATLIYAHELASLHWDEYGDGVEAKQCSELVTATWQSLSKTAAPEFYNGIKPMLINSIERLMILATSYDESDKWASELKRISPDAPILVLHKIGMAGREGGQLRIETMVGQGAEYLRFGQQPAVAACILLLVLTCKQELHKSQSLWKKAIVAYCLSIERIGTKANNLLQNKSDAVREVSMVYKHVLPFIKEYCDAFPEDEDVKPGLLHATMIADSLRQHENGDLCPLSNSNSSWLHRAISRLFANIRGER